MQLLATQQEANMQLQVETQKHRAAKMAHIEWLKSLAQSTQQGNLNHIFAS